MQVDGKDSPLAVEIAFATRQLRDICEKEASAVDAFGVAGVGALKRRLADLRAANSVEDLVAGRPTQLDGADAGQLSIPLTKNLRMVLSANHPHNPTTENGDINWAQVRRVKLQRIERPDG